MKTAGYLTYRTGSTAVSKSRRQRRAASAAGFLSGCLAVLMAVLLMVVSTLPAQAMANPFTEYDSLEEAEEGAGFVLGLPTLPPEGYGQPVYRAIPGSFLEVVWKSADGGDFRIRKGLAGDGDASGDYNEYPISQKITLGGVDITIRRDESRVYVISAVAGDYSYAVTSNVGITVPQIMAMRRELFQTWLPDALSGQSRETCENFMGTFFTKMYDTRISLMYLDDLDPDYFFYIPLDSQGNAATVVYMYNETYQITDPVVSAQ